MQFKQQLIYQNTYKMAKLFKITGYWKDDKSEFENALIYEYDECPPYLVDDDVFYFGLSENDIIECIKNNEDSGLEFAITEYKTIL